MPRKTSVIRKPIRPAAAAAPRKVLREDVRAFKQEVILETAIEIFYRNGYQNATVDDVAAAVSITKAAIYYYFESKEALLQAMIERCSDLTVISVDRGIAAGSTPVEKLALACFCFASMVLDHQKLIAVYFREERCFPAALHERVTSTEKDVTLKLAKVIEAGVRRGDFPECDAQTMALEITGMISMSFYWYTEHGRLPKSDLCRQFAVGALHLAQFSGEISIDQWLLKLPPA